MSTSNIDQKLHGTPQGATDFLKQSIRRERQQFGVTLFASFIINALGVALALFSMQVFDRLIPFKSSDTLMVLGAGLAIALIIQAALKNARNGILDRLGRTLEVELSQRIFNKTLQVRLDERPNSVGTLAARISEFDVVSRMLSAHSLFCLFDLPFVVLYIGIVYAIAGQLAWIPLLAVPASLLINRISLGRLPALAADEIVHGNRRHGMLVESIDGAETIKAYHAEGWFSRRWYNLTQHLSSLSVGTRSLVSNNQNLDEAFNQIVHAATLVAGVYLVVNTQLTIGALVASTLLIARSLQPVSLMGSLMTDWSHAREAIKGLDQFLVQAGAEAGADGTPPIRLERFSPHVSLEKAELALGEDKTVAINIPALEIKAGEKVAIIGPTGSGKTSLLRLMSGLYRPSSGRCFASDVDMQLQDPAFLRRHIAYLPQQPTLFNSSLKDNLCAGLPPLSDTELLDICKLVGLDKLVSGHPRGLNLPISEGGQGLSGGQSKLVGLARVLAQKAGLILLDEPTGALDPQSETQLLPRLKGFFKPEQTVVLVTHKMNLLQLVDRIIVVDQGKITLDGPRETVLARLSPQKPATPQAAASAAVNAALTPAPAAATTANAAKPSAQ